MQILLKATKNPKKKKKNSQNRSKARQERVASGDHKELAKRALKGKCGGERRENCSAASHGMARENRCRVKWRQGGQRKRRKVCNVFKANFRPTKPYLSHVTGKGKGNCNCNCYCKGNCDCNVTRNPPTLFRFLLHCPPFHPPCVSFWPFTAIESFRAHFGFWNRMRALANWIWLVCVQSSTWLQRLFTFRSLAAIRISLPCRREDMFMPWKLANTFRTFRNFGREIYADSPSSIRFGFCNWMRNVTPSRREGSTQKREADSQVDGQCCGRSNFLPQIGCTRNLKCRT